MSKFMEKKYCKHCGHPLELFEDYPKGFNEYTGKPITIVEEKRCVNPACGFHYEIVYD